jgi:hypothetical protein
MQPLRRCLAKPIRATLSGVNVVEMAIGLARPGFEHVFESGLLRAASKFIGV